MNPPADNHLPQLGVSRRKVLGLTVAGAAGLITAACGGSGSTASGSDPTTSAAGTPTSSGGSTPTSGDGSAGLVATSDVPVGGGVFIKNGKIVANPGPQEKLTAVVTQPTAGDFKAFTTTCTHQQCTVGEIKDGTILCPCHGSTYSIKDGSVTGGPAPKALTAISIKVDGANITEA
jgi:Rieske Fe-S protein